jgi:hypothetical protein
MGVLFTMYPTPMEALLDAVAAAHVAFLGAQVMLGVALTNALAAGATWAQLAGAMGVDSRVAHRRYSHLVR